MAAQVPAAYDGTASVSGGAMPEIALYYPYVHPRDESWVKQALLFWPRIQRIVPDNYPVSDSPLLLLLVAEGILVERRPDPAAGDIAGPFVEFVARNGESLRRSYSVRKALALPPQPGWNDRHLDPRLGWIHRGKVDPHTSAALIRSGLTTLHRNEPTWLGMHPALFNVYMCSLAGRLSQRTEKMTSPVTDGPLHHVGAFGWSIENVAGALLTDLPRPVGGRAGAGEDPDAGATLIAVAMRAIVPRRLDSVPVERILELRDEHAPEFARYRATISKLADEVAELDGVGDPATLAQHIEVLYEQKVEPELQELRKLLQANRVKTAFTAMSFQIAGPSTLVGAGLAALASPFVGAGAATAIALGKAASEVAAQRRSVRAASSAAWLVRVEELAPRTLRGKVAASLRRFIG